MNILLLFSGSSIGGAERSLTRMASINDDKNITYYLSTFATEGDWSRWVAKLGLESVCFNDNLLKLVHYIRNHRIDSVYVIGFRLSVYLRFLRFLIPKVDIIQGIRWNPASSSNLDKTFRFTERHFSYLLDGYITNSSIAKDKLLALGVKKNNVELIYNGVEINDRDNINTSRKTHVITVANLSERKGHIAYLNTIKDVLKKRPETLFLFAGRDDSNGLVTKKIVEMNLCNNVKCVGFKENIKELLQQASIFVLPSKYGEGCPTSILEAFANKLPVVAFDIDGISELIANKKDGFLYKKDDDTSMANGILYLLNNPKVCRQFGTLGHDKVKSNFTISNMTDRHNQYFANSNQM